MMKRYTCSCSGNPHVITDGNNSDVDFSWKKLPYHGPFHLSHPGFRYTTRQYLLYHQATLLTASQTARKIAAKMSFDAKTTGNAPEIEMQFAVKTVEHLEVRFVRFEHVPRRAVYAQEANYDRHMRSCSVPSHQVE